MNKFLKLTSVITLLIFLRVSMALAADQVFYYYTDPAGTPLAMSDSSGAVVWRADYLPFGEETIGTSTVTNNKMFVGKEKDSETGLHYFGARYMDSGAGRFVSPDPVGAVDSRAGKINDMILMNPQRMNAYAYSMNNPYKYLDTDGKWSEDIHNHIINMAFSSGNYRLSNDLKDVLKQASAYVDTFQDTKESYLHSMSSSIYSPSEAEKFTSYFVNAKVGEFKKLMAEGIAESAYFSLGEAMHALMDATSPAHEGFQKWELSDAVAHGWGERGAVFDSDMKYLQKSVADIRGLMDEASK